MKTIRTLALTLAFTASAAFANDHLTQIAGHARELAQDYGKMTQTLKNKNFAPQELLQQVQAVDADVAKIKTLLGEFAATNPEFSALQAKDWKLTQDLVVLLDVFHNRKTELLSGTNAQQDRKKILAESQAVVTRATMLEKAALRLAGSGS